MGTRQKTTRKARRRDGWDTYATEWAGRYGGYDLRRTGGITWAAHRLAYRVGLRLFKLRVRAAALVTLSLLFAAAVPIAASRGPGGLLVAAAAVLLSEFAAAVGSALAVLGAGASRRGLIWEAVAARLGELSWMLGFWLAGVPGLFMLAIGVIVALHEYVRAQAVVAGMSRIGAQTASDRPVRVPVVIMTLVVAGLAGSVSEPLAPGVLTILTGLWLVLALIGLSQLVAVVRKVLR